MLCYYLHFLFYFPLHALHLDITSQLLNGCKMASTNEFWYGRWLHTFFHWDGWVFWKEDKPVNRKCTQHVVYTAGAAFMAARRRRPMTTLAVILVTTSFHLTQHLSLSPNGATRLRFQSFLRGEYTRMLLPALSMLAWWSTNGCWFTLLLALLCFAPRSAHF